MLTTDRQIQNYVSLNETKPPGIFFHQSITLQHKCVIISVANNKVSFKPNTMIKMQVWIIWRQVKPPFLQDFTSGLKELQMKFRLQCTIWRSAQVNRTQWSSTVETAPWWQRPTFHSFFTKK